LKAAEFPVSSMAYNKFTDEGAIIERYDTLYTVLGWLICDFVFGDNTSRQQQRSFRFDPVLFRAERPVNP
jgi:hypothetical protein